MDGIVKLVERDGIAEVILNRPDKHNSLSLEMFDAIVEVGDTLLESSSIRAVILRGEGPSFCAGLDLSLMKKVVDKASGRRTIDKLLAVDDEGLSLVQRSAYIWKLLPMPVICAIHGAALGGGCQIALGADIRVIHPESKVSIMESRYGLIPDLAITQTLPQLLPQDVAIELTLSARVLNGKEAVRYGLATMVSDDPNDEARRMASLIAERSPEAVRSVKKLYGAVWQEGSKSGLSLEREFQRGLIGSPNQIEAVAAAFEKRSPKFSQPS